MARAKRWEIPFVSLNGTECRIDIYEENWTGEVTELSTENPNAPGLPTAEPIFYEEENDEDLLKVVRAKTGYINLVELSYGDLAPLYSATDTQHYVEFYYGDRLDFSGYMQAQTFSDDWVACPRELSFPIQSPLAMLEGIKFSAVTSPQRKTLGQLLKEVITKLNASYENVVWPDVTPGLTSDVFSLTTISPYSGDFSPAVNDATTVYEPKDLKYFIEGLCNCYGWMVHDTPSTLFFTRFDYDGNYASVAVANLDTMTGKSTYIKNGGSLSDFDAAFDLYDDNGSESLVRPVKQVKLDYEGDFVKKRTIGIGHSAYLGYDVGGCYIAWMKSLSDEIAGPQLRDTNTFDYTGTIATLSQNGVNVVSICDPDEGNSDGRDYILVTDFGFSAEQELLTVRLHDIPKSVGGIGPEYHHLKIHQVWGELNNLGNDTEMEQWARKYYVRIKAGGKYAVWNSTYRRWSWQNSPGPLIELAFEQGIGHIPDRPAYTDGIRIYGFSGDTMEITFYAYDNRAYAPSSPLSVGFDEITLDLSKNAFTDYTDNETDSDTIPEAVGSPEEASVSMAFSYYRKNNHQVGDTLQSKFTTYPYLAQAQNRLVVKYRNIDDYPDYLYVVKWYDVWHDNWKWRMIARSFDPRNDAYTLTLHRSPVIENN